MLHQAIVAAVLCVLILCSFAVAGLWPFRQIPNDITWLSNRSGVHFGKHGIILSAGALPPVDSGACTIEMWVRPAGSEDFGTLLAFYGPDGGTGVSLHRSLTDLRLDRETASGRPIKSYVGDVLPGGRRVFLTVVLNAGGTAVYQDGVPVRRLSQPRIEAGDCSGGLGVGHPATGHTSWQGEMRGLAIYHHELTPESVLSNYHSWQTTGRPDEQVSGRPSVLYLFRERRGTIVRDRGAARLNLRIPDQYQNIQRTWFQSPSGAFEARWGYFEDMFINIGGFVPFGFALSALLAATGRIRRVGIWTVTGGLLVSLTIEILQVYLPTRNSDLTDVLTNTLGTVLGAAIYAAWRHRVTRGS